MNDAALNMRSESGIHGATLTVKEVRPSLLFESNPPNNLKLLDAQKIVLAAHVTMKIHSDRAFVTFYSSPIAGQKKTECINDNVNFMHYQTRALQSIILEVPTSDVLDLRFDDSFLLRIVTQKRTVFLSCPCKAILEGVEQALSAARGLHSDSTECTMNQTKAGLNMDTAVGRHTIPNCKKVPQSHKDALEDHECTSSSFLSPHTIQDHVLLRTVSNQYARMMWIIDALRDPKNPLNESVHLGAALATKEPSWNCTRTSMQGSSIAVCKSFQNENTSPSVLFPSTVQDPPSEDLIAHVENFIRSSAYADGTPRGIQTLNPFQHKGVSLVDDFRHRTQALNYVLEGNCEFSDGINDEHASDGNHGNENNNGVNHDPNGLVSNMSFDALHEHSVTFGPHATFSGNSLSFTVRDYRNKESGSDAEKEEHSFTRQATFRAGSLSRSMRRTARNVGPSQVDGVNVVLSSNPSFFVPPSLGNHSNSPSNRIGMSSPRNFGTSSRGLSPVHHGDHPSLRSDASFRIKRNPQTRFNDENEGTSVSAHSGQGGTPRANTPAAKIPYKSSAETGTLSIDFDALLVPEIPLDESLTKRQMKLSANTRWDSLMRTLKLAR